MDSIEVYERLKAGDTVNIAPAHKTHGGKVLTITQLSHDKNIGTKVHGTIEGEPGELAFSPEDVETPEGSEPVVLPPEEEKPTEESPKKRRR